MKYLPFASELEFRGLIIEIPRNVLMTRLHIPGFGKISAYNTHLCANCRIRERKEQLTVALDFIEGLEQFLPGANPVLFGGDFNIDRNRIVPNGGDRALYDLIVDDFREAYAASQTDSLDELCEDPDVPDGHCTFGVTNLPGSPVQRIDYVFEQGFEAMVSGDVVFNTLVDATEPTVSDHAGVGVRISLPGSILERRLGGILW